MRKSIIALVFLAFCPLLVAQQALNNEAVIKLVKAGLSDDLIVATINAQPGTYDTSTDGLVALKASGASDKVVTAIVVKASAPAPPTAPATASPAPVAIADPDDPMAKHDVGVYLLTTGPDGKRKMVFIDRAGEAGVKTANVAGMAFSYGISKAKLKAEIPGPHAPTRTPDVRPVFYMYFPEMSSLGSFGGTDMISSPNQFSLLALEEKKERRETQIAKMGFASQNVGADEKKQYLFSSERIQSGMYKVTPKEDLKSGEYAFIMATEGAGRATGTTVVIYDFGVDAR
ncbi:MAG: hypothetical protein ABSD43_15445 [Terracidiphilus sp.]|jgi:hypothetical protein